MIIILQKEKKVLHTVAAPVALEDIGSPKIKKVLADMKKALGSQADGVAIAAPQIGVALRIFVVSGKIFEDTFTRGQGLPEDTSSTIADLVFINPVITKVSKTKKWLLEGCLSVRPLWGEVERSTKAAIVAYDENGKKFARNASGLLAHIFQHETDHLNGILFTEKARNIHNGPVGQDFTGENPENNY